MFWRCRDCHHHHCINVIIILSDVPLSGGVVATAEEVQRLRQQETELKEEVQRQISVIESIKQDRAYYIEICQKKEYEFYCILFLLTLEFFAVLSFLLQLVL